MVAVAEDGEREEEGEEEGEVDPGQPRERLRRLARARDRVCPAPPDPAEAGREGAGAADKEAPEDEDEDEFDEDGREDVRRLAAVEEEMAVCTLWSARRGMRRARENSQDGQREKENDGGRDELCAGGVVPLEVRLELGGVGYRQHKGEERRPRRYRDQEGVDERPVREHGRGGMRLSVSSVCECSFWSVRRGARERGARRRRERSGRRRRELLGTRSERDLGRTGASVHRLTPPSVSIKTAALQFVERASTAAEILVPALAPDPLMFLSEQEHCPRSCRRRSGLSAQSGTALGRVTGPGALEKWEASCQGGFACA